LSLQAEKSFRKDTGNAMNAPHSVVKEIGHYIAGRMVAGKSGRRGDVFDPATGQISGHVALASRAEV